MRRFDGCTCFLWGRTGSFGRMTDAAVMGFRRSEPSDVSLYSMLCVSIDWLYNMGITLAMRATAATGCRTSDGH